MVESAPAPSRSPLPSMAAIRISCPGHGAVWRISDLRGRMGTFRIIQWATYQTSDYTVGIPTVESSHKSVRRIQNTVEQYQQQPTILKTTARVVQHSLLVGSRSRRLAQRVLQRAPGCREEARELISVHSAESTNDKAVTRHTVNMYLYIRRSSVCRV